MADPKSGVSGLAGMMQLNEAVGSAVAGAAMSSLYPDMRRVSELQIFIYDDSYIGQIAPACCRAPAACRYLYRHGQPILDSHKVVDFYLFRGIILSRVSL